MSKRMGRRPETETNLSMTGDSWLKDWYEKEKRCHSRSGKGVWGKKPKPAQHVVVNNKQFGDSIQPSTWKIWISNNCILCFMRCRKVFLNLCLCLLLAGNWLSNCATGALQKSKASGRAQMEMPISLAFVLSQGGSEFWHCCYTDKFSRRVCYGSPCCSVKHQFTHSLWWEGWILSSLMNI